MPAAEKYAPDPDPLTLLVKERPELFHTCCCDDDDVALCGEDVSMMPFTDGDGEQCCMVCEDLMEQSSCPKFGRCRHAH